MAARNGNPIPFIFESQPAETFNQFVDSAMTPNNNSKAR